MTLSEVESLFFGAVTGQVSADDPRIARAFVSDSRMAAGERIQIYAHMVASRQVEALEAEFPMVRALLGPEPFAELCADYLRAHPSGHPDIGQLGRALPAFLQAHPRVRGDLGELALLERTRSQVFGAPDEAPCEVDALVAHGPEAFPMLRIRFIAALRTLEAAHDVDGLFKALQASARPDAVALDAPARLAVWKQGFQVFHAALSHAEGQALALARGGAALGEVCEAFAGADDPAGTAFAAIASWFGEGWVAEVQGADRSV